MSTFGERANDPQEDLPFALRVRFQCPECLGVVFRAPTWDGSGVKRHACPGAFVLATGRD